MTLASENYRSGQPISEYIQNNLAPHFSPDLINPQHFCHSARRKPVRLSKSGITFDVNPPIQTDIWSNVIQTSSTPPGVSVSAKPSMLWPPNGKMVSVTVSGTIKDNGSGIDPIGAMFSVVDEYGIVQPSGRVTLGSGGNYSLNVLLQASRRGDDSDGRQYTITVTAKDSAGNKGSASTFVIVPHDQGH